MNKNTFEGENMKLTCMIGQDNIIYATAAGKMTDANLEVFLAWTADMKALMHEVSLKQKGIILTYSEVSAVEFFGRKAIVALRDLLEEDKQYHMKSAVVGAPFFLEKLIDAVVEFTGRTNMRQFSSKEKAIEWLLDKTESPSPAPATPDEEKTA